MNEREQHVLKIVVERHIQGGGPIGSKMIAEEYSLGFSPATIRHILSALESKGYLTSPHTSSGRIPTPSGYRFFIDSLLTIKPLDGTEVQNLMAKLDPHFTLPDLLRSASATLSGLTQLISVVTLPKRNRIQLKHVEFLPLSDRRVLVVLVLNTNEIQNRIINTERSYSSSELQQTANYLNAHYAGQTLLSIRKKLFSALQEDRNSIAYLTQIALNILGKTFALVTDEAKDYLIEGQNNLLNNIQEIDLERLRNLFEAFTQKQEMLNLLDQALAADGIQILIGNESGYSILSEYSIVSKAYSVDGEVVGTLGVIGPVRMHYDKVISAVDITANLLSAALNPA